MIRRLVWENGNLRCALRSAKTVIEQELGTHYAKVIANALAAEAPLYVMEEFPDERRVTVIHPHSDCGPQGGQ
jgi:hypothetical protein